MSTGRFKRIHQRNEAELKATIKEGLDHCKQVGLDGYKIIAMVDAYFQERFLKEEKEAATGHLDPETRKAWYGAAPEQVDRTDVKE